MKLSLLCAMVVYYQAQARDEVHHLRGQNRETEDHNGEKSANEANIGVPEKELELTSKDEASPKNGPDAIGVPENQVLPEAAAETQTSEANEIVPEAPLETQTSEENQESEGESGSENLWVRIPSWDIPRRWISNACTCSWWVQICQRRVNRRNCG